MEWNISRHILALDIVCLELKIIISADYILRKITKLSCSVIFLIFLFLTKSSKFPASIAKSNKQGTYLYQEGGKPLSDKLRSSYLVMSK